MILKVLNNFCRELDKILGKNCCRSPRGGRGLKLVIRTTVLVVVTSSLRRDNNYNSLQNNKYIDEKFYKHFMMAVLFDCFAFVY